MLDADELPHKLAEDYPPAMKRLLLLPLLLPQASVPQQPPPDAPRRYLLSLAIELRPGERIESFSIDTWGIDVLAICHVPAGWMMTGGRSAAPDGAIEGEGTHGVTWIGRDQLDRLQGLVLVERQGPVTWRAAPFDPPGSGELPPSFAGHAEIVGGDGRRVALGEAAIRLTPAEQCPPPRR